MWIKNEDIEGALAIEPIRQRVEKVREMRLKSSKKSTQKLAGQPFKFDEDRYQESTSLFIPSHSSENRKYIPMEFFDKNTVSSNANFVAYNCPNYLFAVLTSYMHNLWVKTVGGSLETRIRYSNTLCFNTFPIPKFTESEQDQLKQYAANIVRERLIHGNVLSELYNPQKMPESLKKIHAELDKFIDGVYQKSISRTNSFTSDAERLEALFKMYVRSKEAAK